MTAGPGQGIIDVCIDPDAPTPEPVARWNIAALRKGTRRVVTTCATCPMVPIRSRSASARRPWELDAIFLMAAAPEALPTPPPVRRCPSPVPDN